MDAREYGKKIGQACLEIKKIFPVELVYACNGKGYFMTNYLPSNPVKDIGGKIEFGPCIIIDTSSKRDSSKDFDKQSKELYNYINNFQHIGEFLN